MFLIKINIRVCISIIIQIIILSGSLHTRHEGVFFFSDKAHPVELPGCSVLENLHRLLQGFSLGLALCNALCVRLLYLNAHGFQLLELCQSGSLLLLRVLSTVDVNKAGTCISTY